MMRMFRIPAIVLFCGVVAYAHEIGTTRVSAVLHEDLTYGIEIVTDAVTLAEKLDGSPGGDFAGRFLQRVKIAFDGQSVRPAVAYSEAAGAVATIRLTGQIPPGAREFTWAYGWTFASYAVTIRGSASGPAVTQWLEGNQSSAPFAVTAPAPPADRVRTAWRYLMLGFTHIMPNGLDHMLFVLGIYLLSYRVRSLLWQVSAFTVAHSITLGLSMYGVVTLQPSIVEPLIALSIAYVAIENVFLAELKPWRIALVFSFGLLHGLGFAGALKDLALPRSEFVIALLTFNLGVEAGQLAVIAAAFLLVGWHFSDRSWYRGRIVVPVSALIACTAVYWTVQRLSS